MKSRLLLLIFLAFIGVQDLSAQNYSLSFDGINDYGVFSSAVQPSGTAFSAEAWVYIDPAGADDQKILMNLTWAGGAKGFGMTIYKNVNGFFFSSSIYIAGNAYFSPDSDPIPASTWTHVAMTWTQGGNITTYLNGQFVGSTATSNAYVNSGVATYLGTGSPVWAPFKGKIDEVRIWSTARSQTEISNNMYLQLNGDEMGLTSYYKMSNGTGTTLTDNKIGGSYNGTLNNGVVWELSSVLPVHFHDFSVKTTAIGNLVKWTVATELVNSVYEVQRSSDGRNYEVIKSILCSGTLAGELSYSYLDAEPPKHNVFYRIKEIDQSGAFITSKVICVQGANEATTLRLLNNPVTNGLLQFELPHSDILYVFNSLGHLLDRFALNEGWQSLDVSRYGKGVFILKSQSAVRKFVIQ